MVRTVRITFAAGVAACCIALSGCPSPFLARIKQEVAAAPFKGATYVFARQFGNAHPEWSFDLPVVKTDTAGFVYVADSSYRIRKFNGAGVLQSTVSGVSQQGTNARIYDMAFDTAGNMYVTTNDTHKVQKYDVSGNLLLQWGSSTDLYGAGNVAIGSAQGIAVDGSNFVYVVDDTFGQFRVLKFNSSGVFQAEWGNATLYGTSPSLALSFPTGIVAYGGSVYVLDTSNHRVVELSTTNGGWVTDWGAHAGDLYNALAMNSPRGIGVGTTGSSTYIYVVDSSNSRVIQFNTSGNPGKVWGTSSTFTSPGGVAVDTSGYVYVADRASGGFQDRIQKFDVSVATPTLNAAWGGALGTANGVVAATWGVAFDSDGSIAVSEILNSRLERFDATGNWVATYPLAGSLITGMAIDSARHMYVTDFNTSQYVVLDSSGNTISAVGGPGAGDGQLSNPVGVALDSSGNVYVADSGNTRVQVFTPSGYYANKKWGSPGTGNGQFTAGSNYGIAVDQTGGFVYVSDFQGNQIQKFDLNGNFLLKWGTFGSGDGQFNAPIGMAVDPIGNVYVCDMMNHRVQKFDSSGNFLTKFGTAGAGNGGFGWPVGVAVNAAGDVVVTDYVGALVQEFSPQF